MGGERGEQARAWLYMVECGIEFTAGGKHRGRGDGPHDHVWECGDDGLMGRCAPALLNCTSCGRRFGIRSAVTQAR